uniref:Uncharacterized protein n=1 Tax=viral metagenome TaxID=1070528 RepID=A0A6C0BBR7_9ZZZZ
MDQCINNYCLTVFRKKRDKTTRDISKLLKVKPKYQTRKNILKVCIPAYCNKDCKDTFFEKGKKLPSAVLNPSFAKGSTAKNRKWYRKFVSDSRKDVFGRKINVLKDSFYEKISKTSVDKMKKEGALSGCVVSDKLLAS